MSFQYSRNVETIYANHSHALLFFFVFNYLLVKTNNFGDSRSNGHDWTQWPSWRAFFVPKMTVSSRRCFTTLLPCGSPPFSCPSMIRWNNCLTCSSNRKFLIGSNELKFGILSSWHGCHWIAASVLHTAVSTYLKLSKNLFIKLLA